MADSEKPGYDYESLQTACDSIAGKKILVFGDVMLDEYVWGEVQRISPEAPVPVVEARQRSFVPGGAANVCANVSCLEGTPYLVGVTGRDDAGTKLCEALDSYDVSTTHIFEDAGRPTTTKTRVMAMNQLVVRINHETRDRVTTNVENELISRIKPLLADVHACIISDYGKGAVTPRLATFLINEAGSTDKPVIVDPHGTEYANYRHATVIKPNQKELERLVGWGVSEHSLLIEAVNQLVDILPGTAILVTRGSQSMVLARKGIEPQMFPTVAMNVFDVTGAGDTVIAALAMSLASNLSLEKAVCISNIAAGIVVSKLGTAPVTSEELRRMLSDNSAHKPDKKTSDIFRPK